VRTNAPLLFVLEENQQDVPDFNSGAGEHHVVGVVAQRDHIIRLLLREFVSRDDVVGFEAKEIDNINSVRQRDYHLFYSNFDSQDIRFER
jgi:hypothetical protein